jgi:outer membrane protein assembly factor BamB
MSKSYSLTMTFPQSGEPPRLRLWPGVAIVVLQWLLWLAVPAALPEAMGIGFMSGLVGGLAVLLWWAFFSRVPHFERWSAVALVTAAMATAPWVLHDSIANGMMGLMFAIYATPSLSLAWVAWAVASRRLAGGMRIAALAAAILFASGIWALVRTDGITGEGRSQLAWRWTPTPEQQLLARTGTEAAPAPAPPPANAPAESAALPPAAVATAASEAPKAAPPRVSSAAEAAPAGAEWPGFRGPRRDGAVPGVRIKTHWTSSPPWELWRREIGPGWSSFAVQGGFIYTQEQRGDFEMVSCYDAATGKPVWTHRDAARFWESNGGPGPRGTPALHGGRVYSFGATGILNALDAASGALIWTRNAAADAGAQLPGWGFSSSPLVLGDVVIVAASGRLAAYDRATGEPRWLGPEGGTSYSSPHLLEIGGEQQVLLLSGSGATSVAPKDGVVLWKHSWPGGAILQPATTAEGALLIASSDMSGGAGVRRLAVTRGPAGWAVEEAWTSRGLKPYFNDFVVHEGHVYGFDGSILSCIAVEDGARKWKGGRYGNGQLLLLPEQDLLLVLSEEGGLALVAAVPGQFTEIARFPAMDGKTWNHPALAGDLLLVRNGREMVAFRLPLEPEPSR